MNEISTADRYCLTEAQGWMGLKAYDEVGARLKTISPETHFHPDVLELRWQLYFSQAQWDACYPISSILVLVAPSRSNSWLYQAVSLEKLGRVQEAYENLGFVVGRFPRCWEIRFLLARYSALLERPQDQAHWAMRAINVNAQEICQFEDANPVPGTLWNCLR